MAAVGAAGAHHPVWLPPDFEAIPAELRTLHRWVCWRFEPRAQGEEPGKIPYDARSIRSRASSTDPTTWASFDEAANAYAERVGEPDAYDGVGVVLDGDRLAGVDIDDCVHDGVPDPRALALLDTLGAAYVEISPSGTGLRALGYADRLPKGCSGTYDELKVELYSTARYLTLTGKIIKAGPIGALTGFRELADTISANRQVDPKTGEIRDTPPDEHQAELIRRVLSGDVFHDSLRDLAASYVATNMYPGAVVNALRALMDASGAPKDGRFKARRGEIPKLVDDAVRKFKTPQSASATDSPDSFEFVPASDLLTKPAACSVPDR